MDQFISRAAQRMRLNREQETPQQRDARLAQQNQRRHGSDASVEEHETYLERDRNRKRAKRALVQERVQFVNECPNQDASIKVKGLHCQRQ